MNLEEAQIKVLIKNIVKDSPDISVKELVNIIRKKQTVSQGTILKLVQQLRSEQKITLKEDANYHPFYKNIIFWIICFSILSSLLVMVDLQSFFILTVIKYIFGTFYLFFIPGISVIHLFSTDFSTIEKIGLSIALSIAVVSLTGLLLTYTPLHLTLSTITLSLLFEILLFSFLSLYRNSRYSKKMYKNPE